MNNLGLVIAAFVVFGAFLVGLALALTRDYPVRLIGGCVMAMSAGVIGWTVISAYRTGFVDLNPRVSDPEIIGRWQCEAGPFIESRII